MGVKTSKSVDQWEINPWSEYFRPKNHGERRGVVSSKDWTGLCFLFELTEFLTNFVVIVKIDSL